MKGLNAPHALRSLRVLAGATVLALGLVAAPLLGGGARADIVLDRGVDPVVFLSNGQTVTMTVHVQTVPRNVESIVYTLDIPAGTAATKIVYPKSGPYRSKESVYISADDSANTYDSSVTVTTSRPSVPVDFRTALKSGPNDSASGYSGDSLQIHLVDGP